MIEFPKRTGTIGIIGGAGVAASAELVSRIEQKVTALGAFRDSQHPELLLYQATHSPSRSMYIEGRGESFVPSYIEAALKLKYAGASFVAMCCNTAHYARREIEDAAGIAIIDLIAESLRTAKQSSPNVKRIGVLCSDGTRLCGIYERSSQENHMDVTIVYPDSAFQEKVTRGICNIKKGFHRSRPETDNERPAVLYAEASRNLIEKDIDAIILGCTEIPLDYVNQQTPCIDTIQVLAESCIAAACGTRTTAIPPRA